VLAGREGRKLERVTRTFARPVQTATLAVLDLAVGRELELHMCVVARRRQLHDDLVPRPGGQ
jgi:hypothetical protein